jgi:outer membrane protein TolC
MCFLFSMRTLVGALVIGALGTANAAELLTLESVQAAALQSQPLLESQQATVDAQRERAIAAAQLPDPELGVGVNELPVNTAEAWSFDRDSDTDIMVSVAQTFSVGSKRRLRRLREERTTAAAEAQLQDIERMVRRDAGLAFAEVLLREREAELIGEQLKQAALQKRAAEITVTTGAAPQSELLAFTADESLLRDRLTEARQMSTHARIELERWIGVSARQAVDTTVRDAGVLPTLDELLADLPNHPALQAVDRTRDAAEAGVDLAQQARKPDWRLEVGYGYRPEFSEMITVRATVGLPIFPGQRQDRERAAARSDFKAAVASRANLQREFETRAALVHHDFTQFAQRARSLDAEAMPAARQREQSAAAAYSGGRGSLSDVLAARQSRLDVELRVLELEVTALKRSIELDYFVNPGAQP